MISGSLKTQVKDKIMENQKYIPTGEVRTFGIMGVPYLVGQPEKELPNGDILVQIELLERGEREYYPLSNLLNDPKAN